MPVIVLTVVLFSALLLAAWLARRRRRGQLARVVVEGMTVWSDELGRECRPRVFLPPGYSSEPTRRYPVLYLNDGQDAEALALREMLVRLVERELMAPIIVVAIPSGERRLQEYGTAASPNAQGLGTRAAAYSRFVVDTLRPAVEQRYRTRTDPDGRGLLGMSLGGLSAFDIAWRHPDCFGAVGVMSGSFWWRAAAKVDAPAGVTVSPGRRIMHDVVRRSRGRQPGRPRVWLQAGTRDERADRDDNGVIDAIQDTLELMDELAALGYNRGAQMVYVETPGGRHRPSTWAVELPRFLTWAFPGPRRA